MNRLEAKTAKKNWSATAVDKGTEISVVYITPCCNSTCEINLSPGETETELYCHRDGQACMVTISAEKG